MRHKCDVLNIKVKTTTISEDREQAEAEIKHTTSWLILNTPPNKMIKNLLNETQY